MEKLTKFKLRVVSSTALLIFAIFGFLSVNGSLAWFSNNKQVQANAMSIQVQEIDFIESVKYYRVSETELGGSGEDVYNIYKFSIENVSVEPIEMNSYSPLEGFCQILIEVTFKETKTNLTLSASTNQTQYFGETIEAKTSAMMGAGGYSEEYKIDVNGVSPINPLSSIVRFARVNVEQEDGYYVVNDPEHAKSLTSFVQFNQTGYDYEQERTTVIELAKTVYIFVDYYELAVEDINAKMIDYIMTAGEKNCGVEVGVTDLKFVSDFSFSFSEGGSV